MNAFVVVFFSYIGTGLTGRNMFPVNKDKKEGA